MFGSLWRFQFLECISDKRHREESLLVLVGNGVRTGIIGLGEYILISSYVLQIKGKLKCALLVFFAISDSKVSSEIAILFFAKCFAFIVYGLTLLLRCREVKRR